MSEATDKLQLCIDRQMPEVEEMNVYDQTHTEFMGRPFDFYIIGSSHYIYSNGFHELFSCKPLNPHEGSGARIHNIRLDEGSKQYGVFRPEKVPVAHYVEVKKSAYVPPDCDLEYEFEPMALTGIQINEDNYKTWHGYPEYEQVVFTQTSFLDDF